MVTRLYFHNATSALSNLPTSEQSSLTANTNVDAQTVNRFMDTNIGTTQASLVLTSNNVTSLQTYYFTRFVSDTLSASGSIDANTWTYNFAARESSASGNFPTGTTNQPVRVVAYVWRPGTGKVANILDGNSASTVDEPGAANSTRVMHTTFSGSSLSVQSGDVICFEVWFEITQALGTTVTDTFFYDGTTVNTTKNTVVTSHASFLETPQTLTFGAPAGPVDCTVTGKTIYNKTTRHG